MAKRGFLKPYKTYMFRDRDPVIDMLRTVWGDSGIKSYAKLSEATGVSASTYSAWWSKGSTRRPNHCTVVATARAMGKDFALVDKKKK